MAEIIDLFSKRRLEVKKTKEDENEKDSEQEIATTEKEAIKEMARTIDLDRSQVSMLDELMGKLDKLDKGGKSLFTRMNMIESLNSSPTSDAIQDKYVADFDDKEEILSRIMDSTESDWKRRAAYYKALVRRYRTLAFSGK